jgi:RNA polymerase subunit RPABC4/transcription elongation factor Spt4
MTVRSAGIDPEREPVEPTPTRAPTRAAQSPERVCAHCSSPLGPDQEWCLECGTATTLIHTPPDWRIPVAIVVVVIGVALIGFIVVLSRV